jgi:hypothetical protein
MSFATLNVTHHKTITVTQGRWCSEKLGLISGPYRIHSLPPAAPGLYQPPSPSLRIPRGSRELANLPRGPLPAACLVEREICL